MPTRTFGCVLTAVVTALMVWIQPAEGAEVKGVARSGEWLGNSTAAGDFDGDGFADLAVGAPRDVVQRETELLPEAGAVSVVYGSANRLKVTGNQRWTQDRAGVRGVAEGRDRFGAALAAGDFDRDGYADLAIGVPYEAVTRSGERRVAAGAVNVLFGSPSGLRAAGDQLITEDGSGIRGRAETGDTFGTALTAGDFGLGPASDLAIGAPGEDFVSSGERLNFAGVVHVVHGSATGLSAVGDQVWSQDSRGIRGRAEASDQFGQVLAAANLGRGGRTDLAVGVPFESLRSDGERQQYAGAVHAIYGSRTGLDDAGDQVWTQDTAGVGEAAYGYDQFGAALAAANFGNGPRADLAVGMPNEDFPGRRPDTFDAGVVQVVFGSGQGLRARNDQVWSQDSPGIAEEAQSEFRPEAFGNALAAGRLDDDGVADLVVGVCEDQATEFDLVRGAVHVIRGSPTGLHANHDQLWSQASPGVPGAAEHGDEFACTHSSFLAATPLTAGNFGRGMTADLAVGVAGENPSDGTFVHRGDAGAFNVIYGSGGQLQGAKAQLWHQRVPGSGR